MLSPDDPVTQSIASRTLCRDLASSRPLTLRRSRRCVMQRVMHLRSRVSANMNKANNFNLVSGKLNRAMFDDKQRTSKWRSESKSAVC